MKLSAILVDDECSARKELRNLLKPFENIQVVGESSNVLEALDLIRNLDLTHHFQEKPNPPRIIFSTVHEEYVFAFVDNLLKPIDPKRFEEALNKVFQLKDSLTEPTSNPPPLVKSESLAHPKPLEIIPVELGGRIILLHQDEIIFIYTDKDKVYIKTQMDSYLTRFTLRELEFRLNSTLFFRSHRCYLVNIQRMRELIPYLNGTYTIVVDDQERSEIPMSRTKSRILKEMLGL